MATLKAGTTIGGANPLAASSIVNTPAGNIAATTVQAALNELDSEKVQLLGVSGGQTIIGGTLANNTLTLQANSAAAANTAVANAILLKTGNSGGTTAVTILQDGKVGLGATPNGHLSLGLSASNNSKTWSTPELASFDSYQVSNDANQRYLDISMIGMQDGGSNGGGVIRFITNPNTSNTGVTRIIIKENGNIGFNITTFGTSAAKVLAIGSGTAPSTSVADAAQMWVADQAAGDACFHMRTESGTTHAFGTNVGVNNLTPLTKFNVLDTITTSPRGILSSQVNTGTDGARIGFDKARGAVGALTTVATGDALGRMMFRGYDGTNYLEMASIEAVATGTVASTRVPTELRFSTATDAAPSVLTERVRIDSAGAVLIGSTVARAVSDAVTPNLDVAGLLYLGSPGTVNAVINSDDSMYFNIDSNNNSADLQRFVFGKNAAGVNGHFPLVTILENGSTGFNISTPVAIVDARADNEARSIISSRYNINGTKISLDVGNASGLPYIGFNTTPKTSSDTVTYDRPFYTAQLGWNITGDLIYKNAVTGVAGADVTFTERFTILQDGKVGVGIIPTKNLHVYSASEAQALFNGWESRSGASAFNGEILLGSAIAWQGKIHYDAKSVGFGNLYIDNTQANGNANIYIRTQTSAATPINALTILGSGFLGVNTSTPLTLFNVLDTITTSPRGILSSQVNTGTDGARIGFDKARGAVGALTTVATGDTLGSMKFRGYDGTNYLEMASIEAVATGTVASTRVPTELRFSTATNATPSVLTTAMGIAAYGGVFIGPTPMVRTTLSISKPMTGGVHTYGVQNAGEIQSDVTTSSTMYDTSVTTAAAAFTLNLLTHYRATQYTIGAGSTIANQRGFSVDSTLIGATNNIGFFSDIPAGATRWNFYVSGTANNYFAGNFGIGVDSFGTSAAKVLAMGSGTAPSTSVADAAQMWVADQAAGDACFHMRTESGTTHAFGTNVGIGTTSPGMKLEVNGNIRVNQASGSSEIRLTSGVNDWEVITGDAAGFGLASTLGFWSGGAKMVIQQNGNVGIGTTSTTSKLEVAGSVSSSDLALLSWTSNTTSTAGDWGALSFYNKGTTDNNYSAMWFYTKNATAGTQQGCATIKAIYTNHADGAEAADLSFGTRTASGSIIEKLRLVGNGNIGFNIATFGTSAVKVLAIGSGTAPSTSPADAAQMWVADQAAGNACIHTLTEGGATIKLFQGAAVADSTDAASVILRLNELLARMRANGLIAT